MINFRVVAYQHYPQYQEQVSAHHPSPIIPTPAPAPAPTMAEATAPQDFKQKAWLDAIQNAVQVLHLFSLSSSSSSRGYSLSERSSGGGTTSSRYNKNRRNNTTPTDNDKHPSRRRPGARNLNRNTFASLGSTRNDEEENNGNVDEENPWEESLHYLSQLEEFLLQRHSPLHHHHHQEQQQQPQDEGGGEKLLSLEDSPNVLPPRPFNMRGEETDYNNHDNVATDEAGDEVLLHSLSWSLRLSSSSTHCAATPQPINTTTTMTTTASSSSQYTARRLLIRIHTSQAELYVGYGRYLEQTQRRAQQQQPQQQQAQQQPQQQQQHTSAVDSYSNQHGNHRTKSTSAEKIHLWTRVASLAALAFEKGQAGLVLADTAVSSWLQQQEQLLMIQQQYIHEQILLQQQQHKQQHKQQQTRLDQDPLNSTNVIPPSRQHEVQHAALVQDAEIVAVAIHQLVQYKERLEHDISREQNRLHHRLRPLWQSRDQVKQRLGQDYWYSNPSPKYDHAKIRVADEAALKQVNELLQQMEQLTVDTLSQSAYNLQQKLGNASLVDPNLTIPPSFQQQNAIHGSAQHQQRQLLLLLQQQQQRYNGRRPSQNPLSIRVSRGDYPDPNRLNTGWTFTGSLETLQVEYYDFVLSPSSNDDGGSGHSVLVQLDWYYATATLQTSLYYPSPRPPQQQQQQLLPPLQLGKTIPLIMEGTRVTPTLYREILNNPSCTVQTRNGIAQVVPSPPPPTISSFPNPPSTNADTVPEIRHAGGETQEITTELKDPNQQHEQSKNRDGGRGRGRRGRGRRGRGRGGRGRGGQGTGKNSSPPPRD